MENIKYIGKRNLSCNDGDGNCQKRRRRIIYGFYNLTYCATSNRLRENL